jgi:uncharacterized protein YifN (PemK superfamily)
MVTECRAGNVFMLDFGELELEPPEMVKRRMVAVVSPKGLNNDRNLATVIPLSTCPPREAQKHVVPLSKEYYWAGDDQIFAKCDMIYTLSLARLEHLTAYKRSTRGNNYQPIPQLSADDLRNIRIGIAHAVGLETFLASDARREFSTKLLERFRRLMPRYAKSGAQAE